MAAKTLLNKSHNLDPPVSPVMIKNKIEIMALPLVPALD